MPTMTAGSKVHGELIQLRGRLGTTRALLTPAFIAISLSAHLPICPSAIILARRRNGRPVLGSFIFFLSTSLSEAFPPPHDLQLRESSCCLGIPLISLIFTGGLESRVSAPIRRLSQRLIN